MLNRLVKLSNKSALMIFLIFLCVGCFAFGFSPEVEAHPGNTAADGGHYCWTNCDYWGEVYGERHFHGGGSYAPYGPTATEQGEENGQNHAEDINRAYIEENAEAEADEDGYQAGLSGNEPYNDPDYSLCDEEVDFENTPDYEYAVAFQDSYSEACRDVYEQSYDVAYTSAYDRGEQGKISTEEVGDENSNNWWWLVPLVFYGGIIAVGGTYGLWEQYGDSIKEWLR